MKARYKCSPIISDKWPPTPSKKYIRLAVVESEKLRKEDSIERILKGNVINKLPKRRNLTEEQILDLCVKQVGKGRVIVIEGAPGIGKSTLAWELCRKWEEYARMKAYSLVILLKLREKKVHEISDVSSLFYAYDGEDKVSLVKKVKNNQGKGVLFVLDGFDELPKSLQREGVLVDLLQKSLLPECTVIVTSRPSVLDSLLTFSKPVIEKRIQILGFSQESIRAYVASVFSSSKDELEGFESFIFGNRNPAIVSLMYVPLYAAFLVMIYRNTAFKGSLPRTITQLYTELCLTILNRHLTNIDNSSIYDLKDIPDGLCRQFLELSKLAYQGFEKEEVIFHGKIGEHFGFLDAVPDLYGGREISFNFLHLTLQEFFAAYHISQMPDKGVELFRRNGHDERWNVVWRFVAGLTEFKYLDKSSVRAFSEVDGKFNPHRLNLFLIQCLFEAQTVKLDFQSTFRHKSMRFTIATGTSWDHYALGYCIANCTTRESSWKIKLYTVFPWDIHAFTRGLMTSDCSAGVIELLRISVAFQSSGIGDLKECIGSSKLSPLHSVTSFHLCGANLTSNKEKIHLLEVISHMPHLETLGIFSCGLCDACAPRKSRSYHACIDTDGLLKLLKYLPNSKVTSLNIADTGLEYFLEESPLAKHYRAAFQALISPHGNLDDICIGQLFDDNYSHQGNQTISRLVSSSSLKKVYVCLQRDSLLNAFSTNSHITELDITHINAQKPTSGDKWARFASGIVKVIQHSTALEKLSIGLFSNNPRDTSVLRTISTALPSNKNLKELHLQVKEGDKSLQRSLQEIDSRVSLPFLKENTRSHEPQHNHTPHFLIIICAVLLVNVTCITFILILISYWCVPTHYFLAIISVPLLVQVIAFRYLYTHRVIYYSPKITIIAHLINVCNVTYLFILAYLFCRLHHLYFTSC